MKLKLGFAVLGLLAIVGQFGCGGSGSPLPDPNYRFINLCTDVTLDFVIDGTVTVPNVGFMDSTTTFKTVEAKIKDFGIEQNGSTVLLDNQAFTLTGNTDTLMVAFGLLNNGTETEKRAQFAQESVNRIAPNGTKARVYAFNAFDRDPGNQNFSIIFKNPGTLSSINFPSIAFGNMTMLEIDASTQTLVAQRENTETEVATVPKTFEAGKIYVMALTGTESGTGATAPTINFIEIPAK